MKILILSLSGLSLLLLASTLICGFWIGADVARQTIESLGFHRQIAVATGLVCTATMITAAYFIAFK